MSFAMIQRPPYLPPRPTACTRPVGRIYQQWSDLLFLHWRYSAAVIQATLPEGLFVDTFDGFAHTGCAPDHVITSRGVDVAVFPLEHLGAG